MLGPAGLSNMDTIMLSHKTMEDLSLKQNLPAWPPRQQPMFVPRIIEVLGSGQLPQCQGPASPLPGSPASGACAQQRQEGLRGLRDAAFVAGSFVWLGFSEGVSCVFLYYYYYYFSLGALKRGGEGTWFHSSPSEGCRRADR